MKFSIVTPTYNRLPFAQVCIRWALPADHARFFEWIIVDDGSTDGTEHVVAGELAHDTWFPIHYHRQEKSAASMWH